MKNCPTSVLKAKSFGIQTIPLENINSFRLLFPSSENSNYTLKKIKRLYKRLDDYDSINPTSSGGGNNNTSNPSQYVNKKKRSLLNYESGANQNTGYQTNFVI